MTEAMVRRVPSEDRDRGGCSIDSRGLAAETSCGAVQDSLTLERSLGRWSISGWL